MAFRGWKVEALEFFDALEAENTKANWLRNKTTYETKVRAPMEELLAELQPEWGEGRIFRPYRDIRFSSENIPDVQRHRECRPPEPSVAEVPAGARRDSLAYWGRYER
jgi:uncharacterized protein (DUF2461 family)